MTAGRPETPRTTAATHRGEAAKVDALRRLVRPLRLTRLGMAAERFARSFWPLWSVLFALAAALFLGLHETAPLELVWALGVTGLAASGWFLWRGISSFRWPSREDAVERLDTTLPGRPLQALSDVQAIGAGDDASAAVWAAHIRRMADRAGQATPVSPDLRLSSRDPYALRYVALTALVTALLFGSIWRAATVGEIAGAGNGAALAAGPAWEGWVEPPLHTGKPSLYLNDITQAELSVPQGSRVSLRLYGEVGALALDETVSARTGEDIPAATEASQSFEVQQDGHIAIDGDGGQRWEVAVIPDAAPTIRFDGRMEREASGQMSQPFLASDDYGVVAGQGVLALDLEALERVHGLTAAPDPREPIVIDLPMPITGDRAEFSETIVEDFSKHPWSGLPVTFTLSAVDAAGNEGVSEALALQSMPGRRFFDPLARALIEQRRDLLWARANGPRVAQVIRAISHRPDDLFRDTSIYLQLRFALMRLETSLSLDTGVTPEVQEELAEALWQIALNIEEGDLSDAMERLRRAQDRLSEAIRNGASDEEIAELMQELREAMQDYMNQLARQQDPSQQQELSENTQEITGDQLQEMLDRLQQLMEEGRTAEAQQLLEQLRQMMENMQVTQGQQGQGQQTPGQQAMEGLAETLRDQQELSDESFRNLQEQFNPGQQGQQGQQQGQGQGQQFGEGQQGQQGQPGQPGNQQGQPGQPGQGQQFGQNQPGGQQGEQGQPGQNGMPSAEDLARRQQELRRELDRQAQNLPGAGTPEGDAARDSLGRAGRAMEDAEDSLRENDLAGAIDDQAQAMEALREGMRNLGEALAQQQQGQGQQGDALGQADPNGRRDPLGRDGGNNGPLGTEENLLQGEDVYRRARDLLDEIRRRSSEQDRPEVELDYLRRLLDRF